MADNTLSRPEKMMHNFRRAAILFAGGPAPAANAVISAAATAFLRNDIEVVGIKHGYSGLVEYSPSNPLVEGRDYVMVNHKMLGRTRNSSGIMIGTARTNPGRLVSHPSHLADPEKSAPLKTVYEALRSIGVDVLISIGGDDTLKTANKFKMFQERLPLDAHRIPIVHLPKTIDNDYRGIDFTFGYFTAVDFLAAEVRNLLADAEANRNYFLCESMGRSAGWLAYGVAIAGEASLVVSVEDVVGKYRATEETVDPSTGESSSRTVMNMEAVIPRIVATMTAREREGKEYGVIVIAEGLAEFLPSKYLEGIGRDDHGHINISAVNLHDVFADLISKEYARQTGKKRKVNAIQLGYEARCARPHAFDVMLGSQLGVGAYRALVEKRLNGVMVSISGQLQLEYVPFEDLVDPETLVTVVRYIERDSDFQKLTRFLETYVDDGEVHR
ncbi:6-phosphofructokinase [Bythopirellula polymerisocia]|uniref:6-phosphofructokinase n=1 Tax=Bythopirellula polymerisocia TaxID=2528003 RepID=A0A5C6CIN6_9BACT|nr:6-phosphofructokinase [Bythopirellula polymerisocia]TWU24643.1 6-phosphofructokinase [Bythopirellula polymerisocia]